MRLYQTKILGIIIFIYKTLTAESYVTAFVLGNLRQLNTLI